MSQSESFDAFYARTSWNVTSQMHALAGEDPLADHAIREAYAKAYQQWYEVSTYPDSEAWVLGVANDAYQRRLAEAAAMSSPGVAPGHDPLSWPGMFRPPRSTAEPAADPDATLAPRPGAHAGAEPTAGPTVTASPGVFASPGSFAGAGAAAGQGAEAAPGAHVGGPLVGDGSAQRGVTADWADPFYGGGAGNAVQGGGLPGWHPPAGAMPTAAIGAAADASAAGQPESLRARRGAGELAPRLLRSRRNRIVVAAAAVVVLLAGGIYALSTSKPSKGATPPASAGTGGKPTVHMLAAGQTGSRSAIPWSIVGPGWTLAEVSTAQPASTGVATGGERVTYLVDPKGGKYRIRTMSGAADPVLDAWSGNGSEALYSASGAGGGATSYSLLSLRSGQLTDLPLPAGLTVLGFTRPDGLNILAVQLQNSRYRLERYNLAGAYQRTISTLPQPANAATFVQVNALSSPDGQRAVWGVTGDGMEIVSNRGGLIRKLRVPGAGAPKSCTPVNWWTADSVLTYCNVAGQPGAGRLWLVPAAGGPPTLLTGVAGSPGGLGVMTGAWQTGGVVYITSVTFAQCQGAPSGPGGRQILQLASSGAETSVTIPATTNNHTDIVSSLDGRLLVLAQTHCPGTSALIWFNPATHAVVPLLTAPPTQAGVVAAVPYSSGTVG